MLKSLKPLSISIILLIGCSMNIKAQENIQRKQFFDYNWKFFLGDSPSASALDFDDKTWRNLDLPHDWSIEGKLDPKNPMGGAGGYFPAGVGWYRKSFIVPSAWKDKNVSIYFEGIYMNAEVFINGKSLGVHPYGYTSFSIDLTPYLDFNKENILSVKVDNSKQINCRWYSGSGIYRHVWMIVTNPIHIANWGVGITTPEVSHEKAAVYIKTLLRNETDLTQNIILKTQLVGVNTDIAGDNQLGVELSANSEKEINQIITVSNPLLWAPETPHLYQAKVQVLKDDKIIDFTRTPFGIRSIKFSVENGFELNGKTVKINGGCVHHDNGCLGAAALNRAEERRVELLKSAGFNAIRTSHNPPSEAFLDACDRLGIMVIDEAFDGWKENKTPHDYAKIFDDWWQRDVEAMVLRDRNHPSIIIWSTGNEIIERKNPEAVETAKMLADCIRKIDPSRPVTSAMTTWDTDWEIFDPLFATHDIGGYNYQLHHAQADHERVPSRIIVQTESYPRDAFSNWRLVQNHNYIIGDFVWTAMDYLGESGIGRYYYPGETKGEHWEADLYPWHGAYCGDIDLIGWRKPISHYRNILWNDSEKIYMAVKEPVPDNGEIKETRWSVWPTWESWTWPGYEGKDIQVEVYSKYPKIRVYLNKKLLGEQAITEDQQYKATFNVPYAPGLIKAVGVMDEKEMESTILQTSGRAVKIKLIPDQTRISADGQDLSFVTIEITDEDEILQPTAQNQLQFDISGPGVIAAVDNANLKDVDRYVSTTRKAWNGRALVVIRSTKDAGDIKLKVSSQGLTDAIATISAVLK
ncbi:MAG: glycoside hydrolase family 2 TIM barrel-domain containing protein [Ignavibacteria bacterium]